MGDNINVLKIVKKAARAKAKRKAKKPYVMPKRVAVIDSGIRWRKEYVRFIIEELSDLPPHELLRALDAVVERINPNNYELIKVFNIMRSGMPFSMVLDFFEYYLRERQGNDATELIILFWRFYNDDSVVDENGFRKNVKIEAMKRYLTNRQAVPAGAPPVYRHKTVRHGQVAEYKPGDVVDLRQPRERTYFGHEYLLSECEKEYRRAPWMYHFVDQPIRAMLLKRDDEALRPFTTENYVTDDAGNQWHFATVNWYATACDLSKHRYGEGRPFVPGNIAYLASDGQTIIVETKEMYDASNESVKTIMLDKFSKPDERSVEAAADLLAMYDNFKAGDVDVVAIARSLPTVSNYAMARALSKILVFQTKLISPAQIHIDRTRRGQYRAGDFVHFDRYVMLPEIYKNVKARNVAKKLESILKHKRYAIEQQFYDMLEAKIMPQMGKKIKPSIQLPSAAQHYTYSMIDCPVNVSDLVYYEEDGKTYCLERAKVMDSATNPYTDRPFSKRFRRELSYIHDPKSVDADTIRVGAAVEMIRPDVELAPGLFNKLRQSIRMIRPIYCTKCNVEVSEPQYRSVKGNQKVLFCSEACINAYTF